MADGEVAGGLFFGHPDPGVFDDEAEEAALSIASSAAVAIANARLLDAARRETAAREVALQQRDQVAVALQQSLLPPDLPAIPGLELGAHYHAGTELVGGDFYDVFALAGHHVGRRPGRRLRQRARGRFPDRADAPHRPDRGDVRRRAGDRPARAQPRAAARRTPTASPRRCSCAWTSPPRPARSATRVASAGHPPALIIRADGRIEETAARGPLLGVMDFPIEALQIATTAWPRATC